MRGARLNPIAAELNGAASERGDRYRQRAALIALSRPRLRQAASPRCRRPSSGRALTVSAAVASVNPPLAQRF